MLLGLLSDTHDDEARTRKGLAALDQAGAEVLLHAGDLTTDALVPLFADRTVYLAEGNIDRPDAIRRGLAQHPLQAELGRKHDLEMDGVRIGLIHGDDSGRLQGMVQSGAYDLVVHGHTHRFRDEQVGSTRVVNPGALHRTSQPSVCTFDTRERRLERHLV